ncbi:TRI25 ligase, partial [Amia calva]|nr:TRI25 ligase [Amia calva]
MACSKADDSLEGELTCPVCLDIFRDPHLLSCGHNFCLQCVQELKKQEGVLKCPECRKKHGSNPQLQKNFKLANISEDYRRRSKSPKHPTAVLCDSCLERNVAVKTCLKCEVSMCSEHLKPHLERPAYRDHTLVVPMSNIRKRKCPDHDETFKYYCLDERVYLCNACTVEGNHAGHNVKTMTNVMKDLQVTLQTQMRKADKKESKIEKSLSGCNEFEQEMTNILEGGEQTIEKLREVLMEKLDEFLSRARECFLSQCQDMTNEMNKNQSKVIEDKKQIAETKDRIDSLLKENDPFQFIEEYNRKGKIISKILQRPLFEPDFDSLEDPKIAEKIEPMFEEFQSISEKCAKDIICDFDCFNEDSEEEEEEEEVEEDEDDEDDNDESDDYDEENEEDVDSSASSDEDLMHYLAAINLINS